MIHFFIELQNDSFVIKEYCVGFLKVADTSGDGLCESLLQKLAELGLDLTDCRGQAYDNGSNMKGKYSGVQARFLKMNRKHSVCLAAITVSTLLSAMQTTRFRFLLLFGNSHLLL